MQAQCMRRRRTVAGPPLPFLHSEGAARRVLASRRSRCLVPVFPRKLLLKERRAVGRSDLRSRDTQSPPQGCQFI